jgi:hypothetical protein
MTEVCPDTCQQISVFLSRVNFVNGNSGERQRHLFPLAGPDLQQIRGLCRKHPCAGTGDLDSELVFKAFCFFLF